MRMADRFFDSNIILYLLDDGPKRDRAVQVLQSGGTVSVQVLNEVLVNCRRKAGMSWDETGMFLESIRAICRVVPLTPDTHDIGRAIAERYTLQVYDAMIVGAALLAGSTELISEDMHDGLLIENVLRITNPFRAVGA